MAAPHDLLGQLIGSGDGLDQSDCLAKASDLVGDFVEDRSLSMLDSLLAAAAEGGSAEARRARGIAEIGTKTAQVLQDEIGRFLTTTSRG